MTEVKFASPEDKESMIRFMGMYLHGKCFTFALTVHHAFHLPLVCVTSGKKIIHAAVSLGGGIYRDARGDVKEAEFVSRFGALPGDIRETSESELRAYLFEANKKEISEEALTECRKKAESVWPEWGWKDSALERLKKFTDELEELSRKHGFWIREVSPTIAPVVYPSFGEEAGYLLEQLPSHNSQFFLKRLLSKA